MTTRVRRFRGGARGFTLSELLVAVGLVAVLTLAIGQLFGTIGGLTGTGAAVSEVEQIARGFETRLRNDFNGLNRLPADEVAIVIRNRRVGDANLNGQLDPGERELYLSREDREADGRIEGMTPYGGVGDLPSRAVTVRADEIVFFAASSDSGGFRTAQKMAEDNGGPVSALEGRVYWGHALRPPADPAPEAPETAWFPDGDFGAPAGAPNDFRPSAGPSWASDVQGRNEYAGDFILARQPMLLYGGLAAGYADPRRPSPIGANREYATFVRDAESAVLWSGRENTGNELADASYEWQDELDQVDRELRPLPVLMRHGRVDIAAQSLDDARRWLEGGFLPSPVAGTVLPVEPASPHADGWLSISDPDRAPTNVLREVDEWPALLWVRGPSLGGFGVRGNIAGMQTALAGILSRPLADSFARVDRTIDPMADRRKTLPDPEDALMDLHAAFSFHCSSFEVAWSDGTRWREDRPLRAGYDVNRDGDIDDPADVVVRDVKPGDIVWFDMDFTQYDLWRVLGGGVSQLQERYPRPAFGVDDSGVRIALDPEVGFSRRESVSSGATGTVVLLGEAREPLQDMNGGRRSPAVAFTNAGGREGEILSNSERLGRTPTAVPERTALTTSPGVTAPSYLRRWTGGAPGDDDGEGEYLAVWPFRVPISDRAEEWPAWGKPRYVRIRATFHDAQLRLRGGTTLEVILEVSPRRDL